MKHIIAFLLLGTSFANAQEVQQISVGPSYSLQSYYDLEAENGVEPFIIENNKWDLGFANTSQQEAGIHINESKKISFTGPVPTLVLYKVEVDDFTSVITEGMLTDTISNDEISWGEGALNSVKDVTNQLDFGWGVYNPTTHGIDGTTVYVIKLRDNTYKRFIIESYSGGVYTLKHADLDGTNEQSVTIDKADFGESHLILYSFETGTIESPNTWDLTFSRYTTMLASGGGFIPYTVAGILSSPDIQVVKASNIDVDNVEYEDHSANLSDTITTIGHDFKFFDFAQGWIIQENQVYFVKKQNGKLYKIKFLDFEGNSTGILTFEKTDLGTVSTKQLSVFFTEMKTFPNPVKSDQILSVAFESAAHIEDATLNLTNMMGQVIFRKSITVNRGLNGFELMTNQLSKGSYTVTINSKNGMLTSIVTIQ